MKKHNLVRKVPQIHELRAYFYQLLNSNFSFVDDIERYTEDHYPDLLYDLNYSFTGNDIRNILQNCHEEFNYLPEVVYYFIIDNNSTFIDYKNAPRLYTAIASILPKENSGLLCMELYCTQLYQLCTFNGDRLSALCSDLDFSDDGRILIRSTSSPMWSEFRYSDKKMDFIESYGPFDYPENFKTNSIKSKDILNILFPPYSVAGMDWLTNLSREAVTDILGDANFTFRFLRAFPSAYTDTIPLEPYQLLVPYFQNDQELAKVAVKSSCLAFPMLSENLRANRDFVIQLLSESKQTQCIYPFLCDSFRKDVEIVKLCLTWGVGILEQFAPIEDKELLLHALRVDPSALNYAADELIGSKEYLLAAVRTNCQVIRFYRELGNDREIVLEAVRSDGSLLKFASKDLQNDREIVFEAVINSNIAMDFASKILKEDKDFQKLVAKRRADYVKHIDVNQRDNNNSDDAHFF